MPNSAFAGLYDNCVFRIIKLPNFFKMAVFYIPIQCMRDPVSSHLCQYLVVSLFFILAILLGL